MDPAKAYLLQHDVEKDTRQRLEFYENYIRGKPKEEPVIPERLVNEVMEANKTLKIAENKLVRFQRDFEVKKGNLIHPSRFQPMKPVAEQDRAFFCSDDVHGRLDYLKERAKKIPEDRYNEQLLSSWEIGWRQSQAKEIMIMNGKPRGIPHILQKTFYTASHSGIFPTNNDSTHAWYLVDVKKE
ncbi:hypothetical protein Ciccas_002936 [Cichlidogyrus casuarinus]|uniref:Sperm microtubule inner protein 1 C-terminal domain-containing protein n=1 Tax=Cichlidogyrus casuarinus TaxID=1844966 RepID=A0ABD2QGR7_9PLAT